MPTTVAVTALVVQQHCARGTQLVEHQHIPKLISLKMRTYGTVPVCYRRYFYRSPLERCDSARALLCRQVRRVIVSAGCGSCWRREPRSDALGRRRFISPQCLPHCSIAAGRRRGRRARARRVPSCGRRRPYTPAAAALAALVLAPARPPPLVENIELADVAYEDTGKRVRRDLRGSTAQGAGRGRQGPAAQVRPRDRDRHLEASSPSRTPPCGYVRTATGDSAIANNPDFAPTPASSR